jgi:hypothetical protein
MAGVVLACALISSASLSLWLDLASSHTATAQRQWLFQSKAAAEALIRETQSAWTMAPPAPASGCQKGRCAWQGAAGLARTFWAALWSSAGTWGTFDHASLGGDWPTLPGSQLYCWMETVQTADGTLVRITTWVQGPLSSQSAVMQAAWLQGTGSNESSWISWRELMP